jgi:cytochrome P450
VRLPPGPESPRLAQAWLWSYRYADWTTKLHRRHGPTFTVEVGGLPPAVVTTDRDAVKRLFTGDPKVKRHANDLLIPFVGERSVMVLEPVSHLARRKLLLPPFHGERVQGYARLMQELVDAELARWPRDDVVEVLPVAQALTLDVILEAVLGIRDTGVRRELRQTFDKMTNPATTLATYMPKLSRRAWWNLPAYPYWRLKDRLDALLFAHIASTRADPRLEQRADVLALLVQARDADGEGLTDAELRDELVTLIAAGHETTATAIGWGALLLAQHPPRRTDPEYLDAIVKEILRIRSPVPIAAARHVLEPFEVGGWTIPPEAIVIVDAYGLHHDPAIYPDPERFRPDRFLDGAPEHAFLPFGGGAHRCIGASLAQLEIKVVLGALLERFELAPVKPGLERIRRRGVTMAPRNGARVRVRRRAAPAAPGPAAPVAAATR